jgi:hypothetical protein
MYSGTRFIAAAVAVLACLAFMPSPTLAQGLPGVLEGIFPTQLPPGQTTVLHAGLPGRNEVTVLDIQPAAGITVKSITRGDTREGATLWNITIDVARDAAPGPRTISVSGPMVQKTTPRPIMIPAHVPTIADAKVVAAQVNRPTLDMQFTMTETPNDIGAAPMVWFFLGCGGEPESGAVKGKFANGVVSASIPNPRTQMKPFAPPPNTHCDLEFRASDSKMADSNTLKTTVDFK